MYWYVPEKGTMLKIATNETYAELPKDSEHFREGYRCFYKTLPVENITEEDKVFYYQVKGLYNENSIQNTIILKIVDSSNYNYIGQRAFSFSSGKI
jgi:hemerythrin superfamily protein